MLFRSGKHHDDSGLAISGGGLVVVARRGRPDIPDGVTVATGDPNDGGMFLAIGRIRREVSGELEAAICGGIFDGQEYIRRGDFDRLYFSFLRQQLCMKVLSGGDQSCRARLLAFAGGGNRQEQQQQQK